MNAGSCGSGLIRSAPAFDPNGLAILGGKSQVQIYANRDGDDPVPTVELEGNEARINGALLLPGSVLVAQADVRNAFNNIMDFGGGSNYDSGWVSLLTFDVDVDERTLLVDLSVSLGILTIQTSSSPSGFWSLIIYSRVLRNNEDIFPGPDAGGFGFPILNASWSGNINTNFAFVRPLSYLDFSPEEGPCTYEWQWQLTVSTFGGSSPSGNWTVDACQGRILVPKNEL